MSSAKLFMVMVLLGAVVLSSVTVSAQPLVGDLVPAALRVWRNESGATAPGPQPASAGVSTSQAAWTGIVMAATAVVAILA